VTTETAPPPAADERVRRVSTLTRLLIRPEFGAILATVVVWLFFALVAWDNNFVSWGTTAAIVNRAAPLGLLAIAVSMLMIGGEFDLSVGSLLGWSGMVIMILVTPTAGGGWGWSLWPAVAVAIVLALIAGFLNGLLVLTTKLPSFIITLGSLFIFRGLAVAIPRLTTNRTQLGGLDQVSGFDFADTLFGTQVTLFGSAFDIAIVWWIGLTALATWVLLRTQFGNWVFGAGGDANAARNSGVPVTRVKIILFMTTAFGAFFVALLQAVQFNGSDSLRGTLQEFNAIIAVVVGGTLLTGGYGSVVGAFFGALIFGMVQQGIIITGVDGDWFRVFVGAVLVLAVIFNNFIRQQAAKR
jgi:simple sugar transport system permease protein